MSAGGLTCWLACSMLRQSSRSASRSDCSSRGARLGSGGADDHPIALGDGQLFEHLPQAAALLLVFDLARDAGRVGAGHQHEVAAGERVVGAQGRGLAAVGVPDDLHQDLHPLLEMAGDPRPAPLAPGAAVAAGIELEVDLVDGQKPRPLAAVVDEGGLEGGVHPLDRGLEDVSFEVSAAQGLDLEQVENPVLNDGDAVLFLGRHVDQHRF